MCAELGLPTWFLAAAPSGVAVPPPVVQALEQAVIAVGAAPIVDWPADTVAWAVTVTAGCALIWVPLIVTVIVFDWAVVEVKVAVLIPLELVVVGVVKGVLEPLELSTTVAPWIGWGPYLWAYGDLARGDGLQWFPLDFQQNDFTMPSETGVFKVGKMLLTFFEENPRAACWFAVGGTCHK